MNFVFLSPHFPPNYFRFCVQLNLLGVQVLGLADEPYEMLNPELKAALTEYYKVFNMHSYDELVRSLGYFTHRYGRIDRIDSQNEYWLETEANLRTDFNIPGLKAHEIQKVKRKSLMKKTYQNAGVNVARGEVVHTIEAAKKLIEETGYPVVAKPDIGVGAAKTFKIHDMQELEAFFKQKPDIDYIMEEFVDGVICTFDGLTDREGNLVFYTSHQYNRGIMEIVNEDGDTYYYSLREIPPDLEEVGRRTLNAFGIRERFFHFEFFRSAKNNEIVALEVNIRPPGGLTTDMFNYANDMDIYAEWAHIIVHNRFTAQYSRPYHCCYVGRKSNRLYEHSQEEINRELGPHIVAYEHISGVFSRALGDYGYLIRSPQLSEVIAMAEYIQKTV